MTYASKVINGGKVVIPAELRRKLGITPGDTLVFEEDEHGNVVLKSYRQVIREIQEEMRPFKRPGVSEVDELIAYRRWEAAKEEEEGREYARRARRKDQ